jgi:hypothetical protein
MRHTGNMRASKGSFTLLLTLESSNLVNIEQNVYRPKFVVKAKIMTRMNFSGRESREEAEASATGATFGGILGMGTRGVGRQARRFMQCDTCGVSGGVVEVGVGMCFELC